MARLKFIQDSEHCFNLTHLAEVLGGPSMPHVTPHSTPLLMGPHHSSHTSLLLLTTPPPHRCTGALLLPHSTPPHTVASPLHEASQLGDAFCYVVSLLGKLHLCLLV